MAAVLFRKDYTCCSNPIMRCPFLHDGTTHPIAPLGLCDTSTASSIGAFLPTGPTYLLDTSSSRYRQVDAYDSILPSSPAHTESPGWPSRFSLRHCRRSSQRTYVHSQLCHSPFETSTRNTSTSQKPDTLGLHPHPSLYAEDHSATQHLVTDAAEQKVRCPNRSMRLSSEPQTSK